MDKQNFIRRTTNINLLAKQLRHQLNKSDVSVRQGFSDALDEVIRTTAGGLQQFIEDSQVNAVPAIGEAQLESAIAAVRKLDPLLPESVNGENPETEKAVLALRAEITAALA